MLKAYEDGIAGAAAGATARMLTAPFDVVKIRFQLQGSSSNRKYKTMMQSFYTISKEEGVLALWKGNMSALLLWISYMGAQFGTYGYLKRVGESIPDPFRKESEVKDTDKPSDAWKRVIAFTAGACAGTVYCKCRLLCYCVFS
jgi:solute carrier family 25 (mitochondrial thiamine pyrophosphate transporter), member 19